MATQKQQERQEAAAARAAALRRAADGAFDASVDATKHIPMGQPILRGHHSEGRHLRDLEKSHRKMGEAVKLNRAANHADSAARNSGYAITLDDPEAVEAIEQRLEAITNATALAKKVNAAFKKTGELDEELCGPLLAGARSSLEFGSGRDRKPFPSYWFANQSAARRRLEGRLNEAKKLQEAREAADKGDESPAITGPGFEVFEDLETVRIKFVFEGKPSPEVRALLKSNGWRWAPSVGAWQRLLNEAGRRSARYLAEKFCEE